jgi:ectoine hydroxylase-related dioxygenase (phytanoyl-CoA dioxygenase family)
MALTSFADDGVAVIEAVVSETTLARLRGLQEFSDSILPGQRSFQIAAPVAGLIGREGVLTDLATRLTGQIIRPVRVLYFDKKPGANWAVPWHQDRTIAVAGRIDVPGYETWSIKAGIDHVEPPEDVLRRTVSLRLHVDDCDQDNGPLLILRSSFRLGRVTSSDIKKHVSEGHISACCAKAGDVVAIRGLTIHASERSLQPSRRRVLHVDFGPPSLPHGLDWALPCVF